MRYRFAREGIDTIIGNHIKPEALLWDEGPLVITWQNNFADPNSIVGTATDIKREGEGWLTAEVEWNERGEGMLELLGADVNTEDSQAWLTIYANQLMETKEEQRVVHQAKLLSLFVTLGPEDPWTEGPKDDSLEVM